MTVEDPTGSDRLRHRTVRGVAWNLVGVGLRVVLQVVVLMVLARLITPEEFGVVAAALIVVNLSTLLAAVGIGPAMVQLPGLTDAHVRAAFTGFVALGAALWALVAWQSAAIAGLFGIPELTGVVPVMASVFLLRNLTVGDWLLQRRLAFRTLAIIDLESYAVGFGLVSVTMAVLGAGVGAIVAGHVVQAITRTVLLWWRAPHPARPLLRWKPLRELLGFGTGHLLGRLLGYVAVQADNLVVARWLGPVALGLYGRAYQLMVMPSELIGTVANRVLFPSMARVQDDRARMGRAYVTSSVALATLTVPAAAIAVLIAPELILVVLGGDWLELRPAFVVMAAGIVLRTGFKVSDALVVATSHVFRRALRLAVYAGIVVVGSLLARPWGITGVATAVLVALTVNWVLMTHLSLRLTALRWPAFLRAHAPALGTGAAAMAIATPTTLALRRLDAPAVVVVGAAALALTAAAVTTVRLAPVLPGMHLVVGLTDDVLDLAGGPLRPAIVRIAGGRYAHRDPRPLEDHDGTDDRSTDREHAPDRPASPAGRE